MHGDLNFSKIQILINCPTYMKCLHFVKNERRDCILASCNMYNDKSPLSGGRLMVDSPIIPHIQPVYVAVGLYIDRCINTT